MNSWRAPYICARCTTRVWTQRSNPTRKRSLPIHPAGRSARHSSNAAASQRPFRVAIVGSGPAGFYAASKLMRRVEDAVVDMYEQLPVPFGLVRFGVAPDHPDVKVSTYTHQAFQVRSDRADFNYTQNCQDSFTEVAESPRFNFIGNIDLGHVLPLKSLTPHYDAILFAYGASKDRAIGIPGERASRSFYSARAFVGWYNGLPEYRDLDPNLTAGEDAVIVGQGNVALDVARTLLTDIDVLRKTDITEHALAVLSKSKIRNVQVVGRRGPMQAAFTIKEVREMVQLPDVYFEPIPPTLFPDDSKTLPRAQKRITELLQRPSLNPPSSSKKWSLRFLLSPHSLHWSPTHPYDLTHMKLTRTHLSDPFSPTSSLLPENKDKPSYVNLPASVVFRSIGYKSLPLPGFSDLHIPFDDRNGIIPNDGLGRILRTDTADSAHTPSYLPGLYCAGWVKRGPTGVIASTMNDAFATAEAIASDWDGGKHRSRFLNATEGSTGLGWDGVRDEAERLGLRRVSFTNWEKIDAAEKERGRRRGKVREKFTTVQEMLKVLD